MATRRRAAGTLAAMALACAGAALAASVDPPIRAMLWVPRGADPTRAFGSVPAECLAPVADPALALKIEIGRAAFRTPVVLGGQAARAGLACESCHRAGRDNPDFQFPGVSGAPGTADVTSSLFSTHRGNGVDDPRPIPDLGGPMARLQFDQTPATAKLEVFLHGLITEEFDGPEPSPALLAGLTAYVRALDPAACSDQDRRPLTAALLMEDTRRALRAARAVAAAGDRSTAVTLVAGARARLGLIDERFAGPVLARDRDALRAADARLAAIQKALRDDRPDAAEVLSAWLNDSIALQATLARRAPQSLFDPAHLARAAANRRLPG